MVEFAPVIKIPTLLSQTPFPVMVLFWVQMYMPMLKFSTLRFLTVTLLMLLLPKSMPIVYVCTELKLVGSVSHNPDVSRVARERVP